MTSDHSSPKRLIRNVSPPSRATCGTKHARVGRHSSGAWTRSNNAQLHDCKWWSQESREGAHRAVIEQTVVETARLDDAERLGELLPEGTLRDTVRATGRHPEVKSEFHPAARATCTARVLPTHRRPRSTLAEMCALLASRALRGSQAGDARYRGVQVGTT